MKGQKPERGTSGAPRSGLRSWTAVRAEATSVNTDSKGAPLYIALIAVTNLRVAVPICCVCKLKRNKSARFRAKPLWTFTKHLVCERLSNHGRQKLVQDK